MTHYSSLLITIISFFAGAATVSAASPFDRALATLLGAHPDPRLQEFRSEASLLTMQADNTPGPPEVEFSRVWGSNPEVGNKWALSVSQSIDWPGVYAARRQAIADARTAARYLNESALFEARTQARQLLVDAIYLAQLIEMQTTLASRVDEMVEVHRRLVDEGGETHIDYNKSVLEHIAVHRELNQLHSRRAELCGQIVSFAPGVDPDSLLAVLGADYPAEREIELPSVEMLRQRDPSYAAAEAGARAAASLVKVERRSSLPGFTVGYVHETELGGSFNGFSIGVTLPSFTGRRRARAAALEAQATLLEADLTLTRLNATLSAEAGRLAALKHTIDQYKPILADDTPFKLLHKAYTAGQINYLTFIQETNYLLAARREYLDTLWEYHSLLISLTRYE